MAKSSVEPAISKAKWPNLGLWNLYFLFKLGLYAAGYLNLQLLPNLVFMAFLLLPLPWLSVRILRQIIAVPVGVVLLYQDTWLPPFSRLLQQPGVLDFSWLYFIEILERTINWALVGWLFVGTVVYLYVQPWLRVSFFTVAAFLWLGVEQQHSWPNKTLPAYAQEQASFTTINVNPGSSVQPQDMNAVVEEFWQQESQRRVVFGQQQIQQPLDVVFLSVCSLSWDDLNQVGLGQHPVLAQFDVVLEQFNAATSYSGPAVKRLMRASCGQVPHDQLSQPIPAQCSLLDQLHAQGFEVEALFNHNGEFDGFYDMVNTASSSVQMSEVLNQINSPRAFVGFDGSPIWRDKEVLSSWWQQRLASATPARALLYNSITLHDGNRLALPNGSSQRADYRELALGVLDDLASTVQMLAQSQRPILLVLVPEHGASLEGDRMQIAGMREIPSPAITHVPVAFKVLGVDLPANFTQVKVSQPTSYLALAELVKRVLEQDLTQQLDWHALTTDLPTTKWIAENEQTVVVQEQGTTQIRLGASAQWLNYPGQH